MIQNQSPSRTWRTAAPSRLSQEILPWAQNLCYNSNKRAAYHTHTDEARPKHALFPRPLPFMLLSSLLTFAPAPIFIHHQSWDKTTVIWFGLVFWFRPSVIPRVLWFRGAEQLISAWTTAWGRRRRWRSEQGGRLYTLMLATNFLAFSRKYLCLVLSVYGKSASRMESDEIGATYTPQRSPLWPRPRSPAAGRARRSRRSGAWGRSTAWTACTLYGKVSMSIAQEEYPSVDRNNRRWYPSRKKLCACPCDVSL